MLEVRLLGTFDIQCDGRTIGLPSRPAQSLLAYLLLNATDSHRREKLAGQFWPDSTEERARASLRHELWRIRKALAEGGRQDLLTADDRTIGVGHPSDCWLDVDQLAGLGEDASIDELRHALPAYGGELLPGFYDDWLTVEREHLQLVFEKHMARLLRLLEQEKRWPEVLEWADRWLSLGHSPEAAYRALMIAHRALGDRVSMLAAYERCERALLELGLVPSEELRAIAERKVPASNLPTPLTSFIGRKRELDDLSTLLLTERLITLTGSGGVGKTRLSIEVGRAVAGRFSEGLYYLELAPLVDADLIPEMLLGLLRISGGTAEAQSPLEILTGYLHNRQALLLLDNCDHMLDACARLVHALLVSCPALRILATSREALRLAEEKRYRVPSLETPARGAEQDPDSLARIESVKLFIERARLRVSSFNPSAQDAATVGQICTRLDGIPLAIELAAARVGSMPLQSMLEHLDERFALLAGGVRTDVPRHQTLRALIDWSHELLSAPEQVLLRRLSVFAGGWTLPAAQEVAAGGELRPSDVLRLLPELAEKSIIALNTVSSRYSMLETVHEYALDRLREADEEAGTRTRHLDYWLALVRSSNLQTAQDEASFGFLAQDHQNLLAALKWCDRAEGGTQKSMELMGATAIYWELRGDYELWYQLARHVLELPGADTRTPARQRALYALGQAGFFCGRPAEVMQALEESLAIAREHGDTSGQAEAHHSLGNANSALARDAQAIEHFQEALSLATSLENRLLVGMVLNDWAECLRASGDLQTAEDLYERSLVHKRQTHNRFSVAIGLLNLAQVATARHNLIGARERLIEALAVIAESQFPNRPTSAALHTCAAIMAASDDWRNAARFLGATEAQRLRLGEGLERADQQFIEPWIALTRRTLGEAAYAEAFREGAAMPVPDALAEARLWLEAHP